MLLVPTKPLANQVLQVPLASQAVTLHVFQTAYGLFMDVYVGPTRIIGGVICQNFNRIVRGLYLGFTGDFGWFDTQGTDDPVYFGLGTRWQLFYIEASELPPGEG